MSKRSIDIKRDLYIKEFVLKRDLYTQEA